MDQLQKLSSEQLIKNELERQSTWQSKLSQETHEYNRAFQKLKQRYNNSIEYENRDLAKERLTKERDRILKLLRQTETMLNQPTHATDNDTLLL